MDGDQDGGISDPPDENTVRSRFKAMGKANRRVGVVLLF